MACPVSGAKTDALRKPGLFRRRRMTTLRDTCVRIPATPVVGVRESRLTSASKYPVGRKARWTILLHLTVLLTFLLPVRAETSDDRIPFGPLDEVDMEQLIK